MEHLGAGQSCNAVVLDWNRHREKIQFQSQPSKLEIRVHIPFPQISSQISHWFALRGWFCGIEEEDGETGCAGEISDLRAFPFPAKDYAGSLEGLAHEDSPQGLRELDQRHSLAWSPRRNLHVSLFLSLN